MKQNKIIVAVSPNETTRQEILKRILLQLGFAIIPGDAAKLIRPSVYDIDLTRAYFVCADNFNFRESEITRQRLYEMAARGIAVILGVKRLPREFEYICEAIYE